MFTAKQFRSRYASRPRGERRPIDVIGNAVKVMRIATREESDDREDAPAPSVIGAGGDGGARHLHHSTEHAILRMDAYGFGVAA